MGQRACKLIGLTAVLVLSQSRARAFSDPYRFNDDVLAGGGGGRWFTGSPADGYGCDVCHAGARLRGIIVQGLPERYLPGTMYDIQIDWPASEHVTAVVEVTDELGNGAGALALPSAPLPATE